MPTKEDYVWLENVDDDMLEQVVYEAFKGNLFVRFKKIKRVKRKNGWKAFV